MTVPEGHSTKQVAGARARAPRGASLARATRAINAELDKLEPGGRLPSQRAIAARLGVSAMTVRRAIANFIEQGRVVTHDGVGMVKVGAPLQTVRGRAASEIEAILDQLESGHRLPSNREIATRLGVSHETVRRAIATLARQGRVVTRPGRGGTFKAGAALQSAGERTASEVEAILVRLGPGDRLPGQREIAKAVGVSVAIVNRAIAILVARGRVVTRGGRRGGTFKARSEASPTREGEAQ